MLLLTAGILLWAAVHFIPSLAQPLKRSMVAKLGGNGYKAIFSLLVIAALLMMVFGWRSIEVPGHLYTLPAWSRSVGMLLVLLAFVLFIASNAPTRIRQFVRHPQLTGVTVWALAHLLMNGDVRSLILFGGMGLWAVLEIVAINRRDAEWVKPAVPGWGKEALTLTIALVVYAAVSFAHPWIAGMPVR